MTTHEYARTPQEAVELAQAWLDRYRPELKATALKALSRKEEAELDREEALDDLKKMVKPGQTVYTILRHVSGSGMRRAISLHVVDKKSGRILNITHSAALLLDRTVRKEGGHTIDGCGMDMGFALTHVWL